MTKKLVLMGLVGPEADQVEAFNDWYLGNHVEDTFNCPEVSAVRCLKAVKGFLGAPPAEYLTIYEFVGDDAEEAEAALTRYQSDPQAWSQRRPNNGSMQVVGAGWYEEELVFAKEGER